MRSYLKYSKVIKIKDLNLISVFIVCMFASSVVGGCAVTIFNNIGNSNNNYDLINEQEELNYLDNFQIRNITMLEVLSKCNFEDNIEYIDCLNDFHNKYINYRSCKGRATHSAETTINVGYGCCRDSVRFYQESLDIKGISHQRIKVPLENPTHTFLIAEIDETGSYIVLDENAITIMV